MADSILINTNAYRFSMPSKPQPGPIVIYISNDQFGKSATIINDGIKAIADIPFNLCELTVYDWDTYLTPWKADAFMKGRTFNGQAAFLLQSLENDIIRAINDFSGNSKVYIAGYSLAGLFALYSLYETSIFNGAVCCSPSVWYPGWGNYANTHELKKGCCVYLSLGKLEKNTKHPLMKTVEDNINLQYDLLNRSPLAKGLQLDINEGGHFSNTNARMAAGITWLINKHQNSIYSTNGKRLN